MKRAAGQGDGPSQAPARAESSAEPKRVVRRWLWGIRANSRLSFILQISSRALTSALNLIWIRLLLAAMGRPLNGLYLACTSVFSLGGLGDLGMGGAFGIRVGQYLGQGDSSQPEFRRFLASARTLFLVLAAVSVTVFLALSHWLPLWLRFPTVPGSGSMTKVFGVGSAMVGVVLLFSYIGNLNYACGNIAWPVLSDFVLLQLSLLAHWALARLNQPLWVQFVPYLLSGIAKFWITRAYVRASHPHLGRLLPLGFDRGAAAGLFEGSLWAYLCSLGNAVYRNVDAVVINAGFPAGTLPGYNYNYKFCELMVFVVTSASFVVLPKMTQWMASPRSQDQQRLRADMRRLNQFQTLLGCGAALCYLAANDAFMKIWFLHSKDPIRPAHVTLQIAFALNMAVTASGDAALQLSLRSGSRGLRVTGVLVGICGLVNLGFSILGMRMGSLTGIAMATVLAQSLLMLGTNFYLCRHLGIGWVPWALRGCLLPLAGVALAGWLRALWPMDSLRHGLLLVCAYAGLFIAGAWLLGAGPRLIKEEVKILSKMFRR